MNEQFSNFIYASYSPVLSMATHTRTMCMCGCRLLASSQTQCNGYMALYGNICRFTLFYSATL